MQDTTLWLLLQAARVFVVDMLMSAQGGSVRVLPCLAAALDAWPEALPALAGAPTDQGCSHDHVRVLHSVLQQMYAAAAALDGCADSWYTHASDALAVELHSRQLPQLMYQTSSRPADSPPGCRDAGVPGNEVSHGNGSAALKLMAMRLRELGLGLWGWPQAADVPGSRLLATADESWAALHRLVEREETEMR